MAPAEISDKRLAKKPRLDLPDGFTKSSSSARKIAPVQFVSAFDTRAPASKPTKTGAKTNLPPLKAPPPPKSAGSGGAATTNLKPPVLRVLKPPILPLPPPGKDSSASKRNLQPLRSMVPPPIAGPSRVSTSEMKTIFTTNVALATDFRTESGKAEVLSLYLKQHGHGFVDPTERELRRGLETSPEKLTKTKNAKFARGGLAGKARILLKQRQTALALWQAALELELRANRRPTPDMRLRVVSILHAATEADHLRVAHPPCLALLRCAIMPEFRQEEIMLLLNFDAASGASTMRFHKIANLHTGRDIFLWKPWQTVKIPSSSAELLAHRNVDGVTSGEASDEQTMLFCTRFWLAPF